MPRGPYTGEQLARSGWLLANYESPYSRIMSVIFNLVRNDTLSSVLTSPFDHADLAWRDYYITRPDRKPLRIWRRR